MEKASAAAPHNFDFKPHIMIVESRYYDPVADLLLRGAQAALERVGATVEVFTVPGALEIPAVILYAVKSLNFDAVRRRFDGFVALGCVLKGATMHDEIVGQESARGLQELTRRHTLAIGNGILTCNTMEQALERADPTRQDRGGAAADACLSLLHLKQHFHLLAKRRWVAR